MTLSRKLDHSLSSFTPVNSSQDGESFSHNGRASSASRQAGRTSKSFLPEFEEETALLKENIEPSGAQGRRSELLTEHLGLNQGFVTGPLAELTTGGPRRLRQCKPHTGLGRGLQRASTSISRNNRTKPDVAEKDILDMYRVVKYPMSIEVKTCFEGQDSSLGEYSPTGKINTKASKSLQCREKKSKDEEYLDDVADEDFEQSFIHADGVSFMTPNSAADNPLWDEPDWEVEDPEKNEGTKSSVATVLFLDEGNAVQMSSSAGLCKCAQIAEDEEPGHDESLEEGLEDLDMLAIIDGSGTTKIPDSFGGVGTSCEDASTKDCGSRSQRHRKINSEPWDIEDDDFDCDIELASMSPTKIGIHRRYSVANSSPRNDDFKPTSAQPQNPSQGHNIHSDIVQETTLNDQTSIPEIPARRILSCFRIGEAYHKGRNAARRGDNSLVIELFARVNGSSRSFAAGKQFFDLVDLVHHTKPPFVKGVYDISKGSMSWESDSTKFLEQDGSLHFCRCLGRMQKHVADASWLFVIQHIWKISWEEARRARNAVRR